MDVAGVCLGQDVVVEDGAAVEATHILVSLSFDVPDIMCAFSPPSESQQTAPADNFHASLTASIPVVATTNARPGLGCPSRFVSGVVALEARRCTARVRIQTRFYMPPCHPPQ